MHDCEERLQVLRVSFTTPMQSGQSPGNGAGGMGSANEAVAKETLPRKVEAKSTRLLYVTVLCNGF